MRPNRQTEKGASYHVTAQINRQEFILENDKMKQLLLNTIQRAKKLYDFELNNFCIMGNHIHLMIKPLNDESLSKIMKWILQVFAQKFNKIYNLKGHVWYDRFKSKIIDSLDYFIQAFAYISNNPVKANKVKHAVDYKYNGITHIREGNHSIIDKLSTYYMKLIWQMIL